MAAVEVQFHGPGEQRIGNTSLSKYWWQVELVNKGCWPPHQATGRAIILVHRAHDSVTNQSHVTIPIMIEESVQDSGITRPRNVKTATHINYPDVPGVRPTYQPNDPRFRPWNPC